MVDRQSLIKQWQQEASQPFSGWDFSYLKNRMLEEPLPWSYMARAGELLATAASGLDMDTGGAERLLELQDHWPPHMVATEEYPPNLALARERLVPLGVQVFDVRLTIHDPMPFGDKEFDVVLNRHSAFNSQEVARILRPGGRFLTQQVHGRSSEDLQAVFGARPQWPYATPEFFAPRLEEAGLLAVTNQLWSGTVTFTDVGAIVYYLSAVPWLVPDFSVQTHSEQLMGLQEQLESGTPLTFTSSYYLLEFRKPA